MRNSRGGVLDDRRATPHSAFRIRQLLLLLALLTSCSRDSRTPLVIYSPHGRDLLTLFQQRFEQLHPVVVVRWLDMGSQEILDRVRSAMSAGAEQTGVEKMP